MFERFLICHNQSYSMTSRVTTALAAVGRFIRDGWLILGIVFVLLLGLEFLYREQAVFRKWMGPQGLSPLHPYADSTWYPTYQDEYDASDNELWKAYVYYRRQPFKGQYVNVDSARHRLTVSHTPPDSLAKVVFFFGGSTMWGDYQRDEFTIPSRVAARVEQGGSSARITNFGEAGYVFGQQVIELIMQLRAGVRPDIVVFYEGINDVAAAVQSGRPGLPQNEFNRAQEFALGRALTGWEFEPSFGSDLRAFGLLTQAALKRAQLYQRLLQMARAPSTGDGFDPDQLSDGIVAAHIGLVHVAEALASRFGFTAIHVWQPNLQTSGKEPTAHERGLLDAIPGNPFEERLRQVHERVREDLGEIMPGIVPGRYLDLTRIYEGKSFPVFVDMIGHTTETGADHVAAEIYNAIQPSL